jgi:hypothetical protein
MDQSALTIAYRTPFLYTEAERQDVVAILLDNLLETHSALEAHVVLKQAEKIIAMAMETNKEAAITCMTAKKVDVFGATVSSKRNPTKWEYPESDPVLPKLNAELERLKEEVKLRQKFLQSLKDELADPKTGEIILPAKKLTDGGENIAVELP